MADIVNDQQLRVTLEWLARFEESCREHLARERPSAGDPLLWQAEYDGLKSIADELREQAETYERRRG